jgi:hypothetical protein
VDRPDSLANVRDVPRTVSEMPTWDASCFPSYRYSTTGRPSRPAKFRTGLRTMSGSPKSNGMKYWTQGSFAFETASVGQSHHWLAQVRLLGLGAGRTP